MGQYIKENKSLFVGQLLNQFGSMIMGLILSFTVSVLKMNAWGVLTVGVFTVGFFCVLQYTAMWDVGAQDIIRVEGGRLEYMPHTGFVISAIAGIPNFIFAIFSIIGETLGSASGPALEWAGSLGAIGKAGAMIWCSPFNCFLQALPNHHIFIYVLMPLVPVIAAGLGYYAGTNNFTIIKTKKKKKKK